MKDIKVSIVLPIFNTEKYLRKCLDTVCGQTLKDIEIICVNDGSTDASPEIIKEYAERDDRILFLSQPNGGYGKAMNLGLDNAHGKYVGIVEPDDYIALEMFEVLYNCAEANGLEFVKSDYYACTMDEENEPITREHYQLIKEKCYYNRILNPSAQPELVVMHPPVANWTGIYLREFIDSNGIRHNTTPGASYQDTGFMWQIYTRASSLMYLKEAYYYRTDNPNSLSNNKGKAFALNMEYDYIRDYLMSGDGSLWPKFKGYYQQRRFDAYMWTLGRVTPELRQEFARRMCDEYRRADSLGDIDWNVITPVHRKLFAQLIYDYRLFKTVYVDGKDPLYAEKQLKKIKRSSSYKLGRMITAVPRKIKKSLKCRNQSNSI